MVTLTFPLLLTDPDFVLLVPVVTLPKFQDVGVALSWATGTAAPLPVKVRFCGELEASLTTDTLPSAVPVTAGAKFTVNEVEAPAATVRGRVIPLTL
jgi:hypothetical protein